MTNDQDGKRTGIARVLSKLGYCSRTQGAALVAEGRVTLNGVRADDPETPVRMGQDAVAVDGKIIAAAEKIYWMMHKPRGLVTTAEDEKGRETIYSLLPPNLPWMGPVGRLDMESEGLLLLTNDTAWAARITDPESHLDKTYHVQVDRAPSDNILEKLLGGVEDRGDILKAKSLRVLRAEEGEIWLEIILDEGKNRHIRRMLDVVGVDVLRLIRVAIGGLPLGWLPARQARVLADDDLQRLFLQT